MLKTEPVPGVHALVCLPPQPSSPRLLYLLSNLLRHATNLSLTTGVSSGRAKHAQDVDSALLAASPTSRPPPSLSTPGRMLHNSDATLGASTRNFSRCSAAHRAPCVLTSVAGNGRCTAPRALLAKPRRCAPPSPPRVNAARS